MFSRVRILIGIFMAFSSFWVILTWHLNDLSLTQSPRDFMPMQYNVGLGFFLAGLVLSLMEKYERVTLFIIFLLLILVGATFVEYLLKINFGIDQVFIKNQVLSSENSDYLGRMSLNTTLCFMLVSISLAFMQLSKNFKNIAIFIIAGLFVILIISAYSLCSYFFYKNASAISMQMSIQATLGFIVLSLGMGVRLLEKIRGFQLKAFVLTGLAGAAGLLFFWLVWKVLVMVQNNQIKTMTALNLALVERTLEAEMLRGMLMPSEVQNIPNGLKYSKFSARAEDIPSSLDEIKRVSCASIHQKLSSEDLCFEYSKSKRGVAYHPAALVKALLNNGEMESYGMSLTMGGSPIFISQGAENLRYRSIWLQSKSFKFFGVEWKIELWPVVEKLEIFLIDLPLLFLILGWGVIFLLMWVTQLWWLSGEQNKKLTEEKLARSKVQASLERMVHLDVLTDLPNRRHFFLHLEEALKQAESAQQALAVIFLDVDNFKQVNDEFGHEVGDHVLVSLARKFRKNLRETDFISRFGGDEFALVFQKFESKKNLDSMLGRYLNLVREPLLVEGASIQISLSMGVAVYPEGGKTPRELIKNADKAMYRVKQKGKNGYEFH
jgi:diguanylate cyclase (GGDEF)-like protein